MITRMQYLILQSCGETMGRLLAEMQDEAELFASTTTLQYVEAQLLVMAQTLAHLSPEVQQRLTRIDWHGWGELHRLLETDGQPRREEVWYGLRSLVPATLELLAELRRREPAWFGLGY